MIQLERRQPTEHNHNNRTRATEEHPTAQLRSIGSPGATDCNGPATAPAIHESAVPPISLQKGVNQLDPASRTATRAMSNAWSTGENEHKAPCTKAAGPEAGRNARHHRPPPPPCKLQKGAGWSNFHLSTGGVAMGPGPATAVSQLSDGDGDPEALGRPGDVLCEECGAKQDGDIMGGCKITCSFADQPHPSLRKYVAQSTLEDWQRWAYTRGSGDRVRTAPDMRGVAGLTQQALARANSQAFSCPACAGLTDLRVACQAAKDQGRLRLLATDGCYRCGPSARPGKLAKVQRGKAQAVLRGAKLLIVPPEWADKRQRRVMLSRQEAHQAVARAIAILPAHL